MSTLTLPPRLPRGAVLADLIPGALARDAVLVTAGAGLTGLAAQVWLHTPLSPVPFTLQTLAVLVTGATLGTVRGVLSMLLYVAAGVSGIPWFAAGGHGWGGPSFGYVLGFVLAAAVTGELARRGKDRDAVATVGMMVVGSAVVYVAGASYLALTLHLAPARAVALGVTPFLVTDALKIAAAAGLLPLAWRFVGRR